MQRHFHSNDIAIEPRLLHLDPSARARNRSAMNEGRVMHVTKVSSANQRDRQQS
jgi:hypothetical protein